MTGHSLITTGAKVLDVLGYRRMLRLEREVDRPIRVLAPRTEIRVAIADLGEYLELGHPTGHAEAERRLAAGERIVGVWHRDRLACASWLAQDSVYVPYLRVVLPLASDELYQYDSWTVPELRGARLTSYRSPELVRLGRAEGRRALVVHIWPEHVHSLRSAYRNMYRPVGMAMALRLPGRIVYRERRWNEPLIPGERPHGAAARARHGWFVGVAGRRVRST